CRRHLVPPDQVCLCVSTKSLWRLRRMKVTTEQAVTDLCVGPETLTASERLELDRTGYVVFPSLLDAATLAAVRLRLDELERAGDAVSHPGSTMIDFLHHKGPVFDRLWLEPRLL